MLRPATYIFGVVLRDAEHLVERHPEEWRELLLPMFGGKDDGGRIRASSLSKELLKAADAVSGNISEHVIRARQMQQLPPSSRWTWPNLNLILDVVVLLALSVTIAVQIIE